MNTRRHAHTFSFDGSVKADNSAAEIAQLLLQIGVVPPTRPSEVDNLEVAFLKTNDEDEDDENDDPSILGKPRVITEITDTSLDEMPSMSMDPRAKMYVMALFNEYQRLAYVSDMQNLRYYRENIEAISHRRHALNAIEFYSEAYWRSLPLSMNAISELKFSLNAKLEQFNLGETRRPVDTARKSG